MHWKALILARPVVDQTTFSDTLEPTQRLSKSLDGTEPRISAGIRASVQSGGITLSIPPSAKNRRFGGGMLRTNFPKPLFYCREVFSARNTSLCAIWRILLLVQVTKQLPGSHTHSVRHIYGSQNTPDSIYWHPDAKYSKKSANIEIFENYRKIVFFIFCVKQRRTRSRGRKNNRDEALESWDLALKPRKIKNGPAHIRHKIESTIICQKSKIGQNLM